MKRVIQGQITQDRWQGSPCIIQKGSPVSLTDIFCNLVDYEILDGETCATYPEGYIGCREVKTQDVQMFIYYSNKLVDEDTLQLELMEKLEGFISAIGYLTGYSEYTVLGLNTEECTIGGHDLKKEIESHMGEYITIVMQF